MSLGYVVLLMIVCALCRCVIFKKRDINPIAALIPILNKYKLGKLTGNKRLGLISGILISIFHLVFLFNFGLELWIIDQYAYTIKQPYNTIDDSQVEAIVTENIANLAIFSKYLLIVSATAALIFWCMMMWRFTMQHDKSPWWILLWAFIPAIPYVYFAFSSIIVIDGKKYIMQKIELDKVDKVDKINKYSSKLNKSTKSNKNDKNTESSMFNDFKEKINKIIEKNRAERLKEMRERGLLDDENDTLKDELVNEENDSEESTDNIIKLDNATSKRRSKR